MSQHDHSHHKGCHDGHHHGSGNGKNGEDPAIDPVCGMKVDTSAGKPRFEHEGRLYHFCSQRCHDRFAGDPEHYLSGAHKQAEKEAPKGTLYTCPMHPEVVQEGPGTCPICGMALEPMGVPSPDDGPNPELVDFKRRFFVGIGSSSSSSVLVVVVAVRSETRRFG